MNGYRRASLSLLLMIIMTATSFAVMAVPNSAAWAGVVSEGVTAVDGDDPLASVEKPIASTNPEDKMDSSLLAALKRSDGPFKVYVSISDRETVNEYMAANNLPLVKGAELPGMPTMRLLDLSAIDVLGLASNPGVSSIFEYEAPQIEEKSVISSQAGDDFEAAPPEVEDLDVDYLHGAIDAWMEGYTGAGVQIAVIDTGFDMAHPDLQGQQARYTSGPYSGWPIAYDDRAASLWSQGQIGGWVADTTATSDDLGGWVQFDGYWFDIAGLQDVYGNPVSSQSGTYHIGYHTDQNLMALWEYPVGVLVVDANTAGVYDTVYVDVWGDFSFGNDKACTMGDEISYFDFYDAGTGMTDFVWNGGDGYADLSGGMVYWISDGAYSYPFADWWYGGGFIPNSGDAVAFVGEFSYGQSHGTMTSSAALAIPNSFGGMLGGMAPGAKLICIPFTGDMVASWMFAAIGADGWTDSGDEANIISNSYGWSETAVEAGYNELDEVASIVSLYYGTGLWFWSTGNGGPGYGTTHSVVDMTSVHVGAGTTMQYRYRLGYENDYSMTKWGDVIPFSNSGPTRNGRLNAEIIASGAYSLEPAPLNQWDYFGGIGDGSIHLQLGSGTSHATPTAAGGAALGYQAYYDWDGWWPSADHAKALLMAAADDMHFDPLKQGAGWLNAFNYVKMMGEYDGTQTTLWWNEPWFEKAALYPGTTYGSQNEFYPNLMLPGESDTMHVATTQNWMGVDATITVTSELLLKTGSDTLSFVTTDYSSIYVDIAPYIPATTDLLKVTMYMPMSQFDPELDYSSNLAYWLELHDWVDENLDGVLNVTGAEWELYRYTVDGGDCNYNQVMIKDPIDRTTNGLIARLRAIAGDIGVNLTLQLDYYELQTFPWITFREYGDVDWLSTLTSTVYAYDYVDWEINVTVPADAPVGTYAAAIYIDDGLRVQNMPVVVNVAAPDWEFEFGGPSYFDTPYNNDIVGTADKGWRFEVGDWRIYYAMPTVAPPSTTANLVVTVNWTELPTDVNVHVLASDWDPYGLWYPPLGQGWIMTPIASSDENYLGAGTFGVGTNTGGPKEVLMAPMGERYWNTGIGYAPFAVVTRCPVMSGNASHDTITGYTTWLTMNGYDPTWIDLYAPQPGAWELEDDVPGWYDITVPAPVEVRGGGSGPYQVQQYSWQSIYPDMLTGDFYQDLANAAYTQYLWVYDSSVLGVQTWEEWAAPDIDLGVFYDANWNGIAELSEPYWTSATGGSSEGLEIVDPMDGQWIIKVLGYSVTDWPGYFSMEVWTGAPGYVLVTDLEPVVDSGTHSFNVSYSVPAVPGVYLGTATFGFMGANDMFSIPFRIEVFDAGAPAIENLYPAMGEAIPTNNLVVRFDVNDSVNPIVSDIAWWMLDVILDWTLPLEDISIVSVDGITITLEFPLAIREGYHYLWIQVPDVEGNWASVSSWFTVNSDVDVLTAEFADTSMGMTIPGGSTVSMTEVMVRGETEPYADVEISTATASHLTSANETGYYEYSPVALAEGLNVVTVEVTNSAGVTASTSMMIVRDTVVMLWVDDVVTPTTDSTLELSGWTDVGATVTVDGVPATVNADGTWEAMVVLPEGGNLLLVEATDAVGNVNQVIVDVELDTTPPSLAVTEPASGSNVSEPSVMVYGTTDAGATVWVNGIVASDGTVDWTAVVPLQEGWNVIEVMAEDALGNSVSAVLTVEYIPPVYVTPEELAAAVAMLEGEISNLSDDLAATQAMLEGEIANLSADLAAAVAMLESNMSALNDSLQAEIDALEASLLADIADLQGQINTLNADLAAAVAALEASMDGMNATLLDEIDSLEDQIDALDAQLATEVADLQGQIDDLGDELANEVTAIQEQIDAVGTDIDDLQDDLQNLNDSLSEDVDAVDQKAEDTSAFATMLMYLTLILFVIAIILVGIVWFLMGKKVGGDGSGGAPQSMEEVEEAPSEVEREFEALEKEIKQEEL